jgi:hypothetical protein
MPDLACSMTRLYESIGLHFTAFSVLCQFQIFMVVHNPRIINLCPAKLELENHRGIMLVLVYILQYLTLNIHHMIEFGLHFIVFHCVSISG